MRTLRKQITTFLILGLAGTFSSIAEGRNSLSATVGQPNVPPHANVSTVLSPSQRANIDALLKDYEKPSEPGCTVGVFGNGAVHYAGAFGITDLTSRRPNTPRTSINIGSVGKQFTAAAIVLLAQDGKLSLDDDVRKHIPELPDYGQPLTIRQLLAHTSGIRDYRGLLNLAGYRNSEAVPADRILHILSLQRGLSFTPGEQVQYSNSGYFLAALIIERISRESFQTFMRTRIFEPLGMTRTRFKGDTDKLSELAKHHAPSGSAEFRSIYDAWEEIGTGDLYSTVEDLARWDANFQSGKLAGLSLVKQLRSPDILSDGRKAQYGLGLRFGTINGYRVVGHTGGSEGSVSSYQHFQDANLSVLALCNRTDGPAEALVSRIAGLILPESTEGEAPTYLSEYLGKPNSDPEKWSGSYFGIGNASIITVNLRDSGLGMTFGGTQFTLKAVGGDVYEVLGAPSGTYAKFVPATNGEPRMLQPLNSDETPMVAFEQAAPTHEQLDTYSGAYNCPEIATTIRFRVDQGMLLADIAPEMGQVMRPLGAHQFTFERLVFTFDAPATGGSSGLRIDQWRARGMRCQRATAQ